MKKIPEAVRTATDILFLCLIYLAVLFLVGFIGRLLSQTHQATATPAARQPIKITVTVCLAMIATAKVPTQHFPIPTGKQSSQSVNWHLKA